MPSNTEIFSHIYQNSIWGKGSDKFFSGAGSHHAHYTLPYIAAINKWASQFANKLSVTDLGCGDFSIGQKIRHNFSQYTACDCVPELVEHNQNTFPDITFLCLDASQQPIPAADVIIIRQVLQHLSNKDIHAIINNVVGKFSYAIITEHMYTSSNKPNQDIETSNWTRHQIGSHVDLSSAPFNWHFPKEIIDDSHNLLTIVYTLNGTQ